MEEAEIPPLYSERQMKALAFVTYPSASLSLLGSLLIIRVILIDRDASFRNPRNSQELSVYGRLLLGLSIVDTFSSTAFLALGSWAVPEGSGVAYGERGTEQTCIVATSCFLLFSGAYIYNAALAFYYFMSIVWKMRDDAFRKKRKICCFCGSIEFFAHFIPVTSILMLVIVPLAMRMGSPLYVMSGLCGPVAFPPGCTEYDEIECEEETFTRSTTALVVSAMAVIPFFLITIFMVSICYVVWKTERRLRNYGMGSNRSGGLTMTKEVWKKSLCYIGSCFASYFFFLLVLLLPIPATPETSQIFFPLTFIAKLLIPIQGLFNALIALSSRYEQLSQPGKSLHFFKQAGNSTVFVCTKFKGFFNAKRNGTGYSDSQFLSFRGDQAQEFEKSAGSGDCGVNLQEVPVPASMEHENSNNRSFLESETPTIAA